jgi:hypothetical protein
LTVGHAGFRDPPSAVAGGLVLAVGGPLVAIPLALHPLPSGGFAEQASALADTPLWGAIHVAIAFGFVATLLGALLVLLSGGPTPDALTRLAWASMAVGMVFFTGVALLNGWVMHPLSAAVASGEDPRLFRAFNDLLVGFGWLGNPLFNVGLTLVAWIEFRRGPLRLGPPLAIAGLGLALLTWLRGIGSATGLFFLEPFVIAYVPAFLWLAVYGWRLARAARTVSNSSSGSNGFVM